MIASGRRPETLHVLQAVYPASTGHVTAIDGAVTCTVAADGALTIHSHREAKTAASPRQGIVMSSPSTCGGPRVACSRLLSLERRPDATEHIRISGADNTMAGRSEAGVADIGSACVASASATPRSIAGLASGSAPWAQARDGRFCETPFRHMRLNCRGFFDGVIRVAGLPGLSQQPIDVAGVAVVFESLDHLIEQRRQIREEVAVTELQGRHLFTGRQ